MHWSDSLAASGLPRTRRRARRICLASFSIAGLLYLASPFMTLWSLAAAVRSHDQTALQSGLDWKLVRRGLKQSLGVASLQKAGMTDELPGFGDSFAAGVASGMIDEDISPARLGAILDSAALHRSSASGLPHGTFTAPDRFLATIPTGSSEPLTLVLVVKQWRWKIVQVVVPQPLFQDASFTQGAVRDSRDGGGAR